MSSTWYKLVNKASGKCLDNKGIVGTGPVGEWSCVNSTNLQWQFVYEGSGYYQVQSRTGSSCLDNEGSTTSGSAVQQWGNCGSTSNNLRWKPTVQSDGRVTLTSETSGMCLDDNAGAIEQVTCNGSNEQSWQLFSFPSRFVAPYVATWTDTSLSTLASSTGNNYWTLAFITPQTTTTCTPTWGGTSLTGTNYGTYINDLRNVGGDVIVSFGGAVGGELSKACTSVSSAQAAYQQVIDQFHLTAIDLDVESGLESDTTSINRRNQALYNLQQANPGLRVSYTLGVDRTGLPSAQQNVLSSAKTYGVNVSVVNIMAMDYASNYSDMGQAAVDAATATESQLNTLGVSAKVGVTPLLGKQDSPNTSVFSTSDASVLMNYAQPTSYISTIGYWVENDSSVAACPSTNSGGCRDYPNNNYINIFKTLH